ncbi:MAG: GFA family protein [Candidatus Binataceae bacterium]
MHAIEHCAKTEAVDEQASVSKYRGGCHCGRVAYEVEGRLERVEMCNCSICTKKAYVHWIVPRGQFRLLTPWETLAIYTFNTGTAKHYFCPQCGVASFYIARSDPDKIDINVHCLEGVDVAAISADTFDGRNWEAARAARKHTQPAKMPPRLGKGLNQGR